jgi:hypothetical protein
MQSPFEDDDAHPIPCVDNLDAVVTSDAGLRLGIVIDSPLKGDERSKQRLIRKLEGYVREFEVRRQQWATENGHAMKAWLFISLHPESDPEILQLIDQYRRWIEGNAVTLVLSTKSLN